MSQEVLHLTDLYSSQEKMLLENKDLQLLYNSAKRLANGEKMKDEIDLEISIFYSTPELENIESQKAAEASSFLIEDVTLEQLESPRQKIETITEPKIEQVKMPSNSHATGDLSQPIYTQLQSRIPAHHSTQLHYNPFNSVNPYYYPSMEQQSILSAKQDRVYSYLQSCSNNSNSQKQLYNSIEYSSPFYSDRNNNHFVFNQTEVKVESEEPVWAHSDGFTQKPLKPLDLACKGGRRSRKASVSSTCVSSPLYEYADSTNNASDYDCKPLGQKLLPIQEKFESVSVHSNETGLSRRSASTTTTTTSKLARKERNRLAAQKLRNKRRFENQNLLKELELQGTRNKKLHATIESMEKEIGHFRAFLQKFHVPM